MDYNIPAQAGIIKYKHITKQKMITKQKYTKLQDNLILTYHIIKSRFDMRT